MSEKKEGWEDTFLAGLASHGNVSRACSEAGIGRTCAYKRKEEAADFAERWDDAVDEFVDGLEAEADRRGREGVLNAKWHRVGTDPQGRPVYERHDTRAYSDMLLLSRLKALRPERYRENYDIARLVGEAMAEAEKARWKPPGDES